MFKGHLIATCGADLHVFPSESAFSIKQWHVLRAALSAFVHLKLHVLLIYRLSLEPGIRNALFQRGLGSIANASAAFSGTSYIYQEWLIFVRDGSAPLHLSPASLIS